MTDIKRGDVVQLVSGGPYMTVSRVWDVSALDTEIQWCDTIWFYKGKSWKGEFDCGLVRKIEEEVIDGIEAISFE